MTRISKTDYVLGVKCPNAIWFKKHRPDIEAQMNDAILDQGTYIGELACSKFPGGVRITAMPWQEDAITQTMAAMSANAPYIYEATLATDTGEYCAVDILRNNNDGTWDIIEVKSTSHPHDYQYVDVSFQKYVLTRCGVSVKNCYVMTLNRNYVRHGDLDVQELFVLHDAESYIQSTDTVEKNIAHIRSVLDGDELGIAISKEKCINKFYECQYCAHCWRDIPPYSVFDVFRSALADSMYSKYGADISGLPADTYSRQLHPGDIQSFLNNIDIVRPEILREFTRELKWPLYFLDYETINSAVPMYDNTQPYQQVCFQFSLHVQRTPGGEPEHYEYLHQDSTTDPRPELIRHLVQYIGDSGSVIVYNRPFERACNNKMADAFPEYADKLHAINNRMLDLLTPFKERGLYRPCQNGSVSIKQTLPAFVPELSYENMGIHNGSQACAEYLEFLNGNQSPEATAQMMRNLREYCGQDTIAMVRLLDVVMAFATPQE